jgi:hypothetical protein
MLCTLPGVGCGVSSTTSPSVSKRLFFFSLYKDRKKYALVDRSHGA